MTTITSKLPALLLAALLAGCASKIPQGRPAYVYVAENGIITFRGDAIMASELPERLLRAGATPDTPVIISAQGEVPRKFLTDLAVACGHVGIPNCTIREKRKISVQKSEGSK